MNLQNSTILITGGTSGIGLEMLRQFMNEGAKVIVTGRSSEALIATKRMYPEAAFFQSDVSSPAEIKELYSQVTKHFPDLNIVINNAGLMRLMDLQDQTLSPESVNQEIATNLSGTIQMVHQFLPHLLKQKSAAIVNVSSGIAYMPYSIAPVYSAAKAGVHAYTQALRLQLEDTGVQVFEVIPPGVNTNLQKDWVKQPDPAQMMSVEKMVSIIVAGIKKDKKEISPFLVRVIKFISRLMPTALIRFGHREFKMFKKIKSNGVLMTA